MRGAKVKNDYFPPTLEQKGKEDSNIEEQKSKEALYEKWSGRLTLAGVAIALLSLGLFAVGAVLSWRAIPDGTLSALVPPAAAADVRAPEPQVIEGQARVLDGNTVVMRGKRLRLFGVDAPEMKEARGPIARGALDDIIAGSEMSCAIVDRDRHGRNVVRCEAGGRDLAEAMVRQGWAYADRTFTDEYDAAELEARRAERGFWREAGPAGDGIGWPAVIITALATLLGGALAAGGGWTGAVALERRREKRQRQELLLGLRHEVMGLVGSMNTLAEGDVGVAAWNLTLAELAADREAYRRAAPVIPSLTFDVGRRLVTFYGVVSDNGLLSRTAPRGETPVKDAMLWATIENGEELLKDLAAIK